MRPVLIPVVVFLFLLGASLSCIEVPNSSNTSTGENVPNDLDPVNTDTGQPVESCTAEFTMTFPDGSEATVDFCQRVEMRVGFEFGSETAPQIRSSSLILHATTDASSRCTVEIVEPAMCGEGYYRMDGSSGSVEFSTHDCSGLGDELTSSFEASTGYLELRKLSAGDTPGNFLGESLIATIEGFLAVTTSEGIVLSGEFSVTKQVVADNAEEAECSVLDGDEDDDGSIDAFFGGDDCDDTKSSVYFGAPELCDGQVNDCGETLPENETDVDGDNYVECAVDMATWVGSNAIVGGGDCNDTSIRSYPGATELCDGLDNACAGSVPVDEADDDGDGYVECLPDAEGWVGVPIPGGDDCDDSDATVYPGATELCDGQINDCGGTLREVETDNDEDGYVECELDSGGWDGSGSLLGDDCNDGNVAYHPGAPETDCTDSNDYNCDGSVAHNDGDGDGYAACEDCDDSDATVYPGAGELCDGQVNACGETLPGNEIDDDGDGYVECSLDLGGWDGSGAILGDDCNDGEATVYPGAVELCDGQVNLCGGVLPEVETDDDEDGYVECSMDLGGWDGSELLLGDDCNDGDATVYSGAPELCDGQINVCGGALPGNEIDNDGDGYVECTLDSGGWDGSGAPLGNDCNDSETTVYPAAPEICDGQVNTCGGTLPEDEIDKDGDGYVECTLDSGGWDGSGTILGDDCDDLEITVYPAAPELCDGQVNACGGTLSEDEIDNDGDGYVECTLDSGGWDGSGTILGDDCDDDNPATAETCYTYSYANDIHSLWSSNSTGQGCTGCHGFLASSASSVHSSLSNGVRVIPGNAGNSTLYKKLEGTTAGTRMPRSSGGKYFNTEELTRILTWINEGAPNN